MMRCQMVYDYEYFKRAVYELTKIDLNAYKEKQMKRRIDTQISKNGVVGYENYINTIKTNKVIFDEFVRSLERGVKVKMLVSPQFNNFVSFLARKDEKTLEVLKKNLEIRAVRNTNSHFGIIDNNLVILLQPHPLDKNRLISVVKIWDADLAKSLRKEFDIM